jgi:hypothetical protein
MSVYLFSTAAIAHKKLYFSLQASDQKTLPKTIIPLQTLNAPRDRLE